MPSKAIGERWRYIAFEIVGSEPVARNDFLDALLKTARTSAVGDRFRITVFEGDFGIVKVPHKLKEDMVDALRAIGEVGDSKCRVETLRTSGTIKTLKDKFRGRIRTSESVRE